MNILALDIATVTGWAHSIGPSGIWSFKISSDESSGMRIVRFVAKIKEVHKSLGIDLVVFESVNAGRGVSASFRTVKLQSEMIGALKSYCEASGVNYQGVNLSEIKSFAIPQKGVKRDKTAMTSAAKKRWPDQKILDDNHADALWLLELTRQRYL